MQKTVLVVGASGATGRLLVGQLLASNCRVKAVVRSAEKLPSSLREHPDLQIITASILDLDANTLAELVYDCDAVASCLGHNLTFKGIFGSPRRLVRDAVTRLCQAIEQHRPSAPVRFVLMNTSGNSNRDLREPISFAERCIVGLLRLLIPPHADNEQAADFLRTRVGQNNPAIEWVAIRPDSLIDAAAASEYELHASPIRSAIFNAGKTSRVNVAHLMARMITDDALWQEWKGQMPVVYNREAPEE